MFVGSLDLAAVHSVRQTIVRCGESDKQQELMIFLKAMKSDEKVIVFMKRKSRVKEISAELAMVGIVVDTIHGDMDQGDREQSLIDMKSGEVKILIATDVASRGEQNRMNIFLLTCILTIRS